MEKASKGTEALLREIIPCFGLSPSIQSDRGAFVAKVLKGCLGHSEYNGSDMCHGDLSLQERLKRWIISYRQLPKCQETNLTWDKVLPVALLRVRATPRNKL